MVDIGRPAARVRFQATGKAAGLSGLRGRLGRWAEPAKYSRRQATSVGSLGPVAPLMKRARTSNILVRLPTTNAIPVYKNLPSVQEHWSSRTGAGREFDANRNLVVPNKTSTSKPLRRKRNAPMEFMTEVGSQSRRALGSADRVPSVITFRAEQRQSRATPQRTWKTQPISMPGKVQSDPDFRVTEISQFQSSYRPFARDDVPNKASTSPTIDSVYNEASSFAPVARTLSPPLRHHGNFDSSSVSRLIWPRTPSDRSRDPSAAQGAQQGTIHLDGNALGQWMTRHLERILLQPERGPTSLDTRVVPDWRAANVGY
jgi:hypothetical protein